MTRVQEMGTGITIDEAVTPETLCKPTGKPQSKPTGKPQSKPASLLELSVPAKRSLDEERVGNNKVQKTDKRHNVRERVIAGYDARLGQKGGTSRSLGKSGNGSGYDKVISDLAYNLNRQNNNKGGSALNRLHNAGLRLSLRPEVEFVEVPPPNTTYAKSGRGKSPLDNPTWVCNLYMNDTLLASVEASNKPNSKTAAAEKAVLILESSRFTVQKVTKRSKLGRSYAKEVVPSDKKLNSMTFPVNVQNKCGAPPPTWTLGNFVLTEPVHPESAVTILVNSAQSNHVPILFETSKGIQTIDGVSGFVCSTIINGVTVDIGVHMSKRDARNVSADNALACLRKTCPILRKNPSNAQASAIKRDELATGQGPQPLKKDSAIEDSNVGHKMLKMMGWKGGALAKDGIVEPIQASEKFSREGLGYTVTVPKNSTNEINMKAVRKILEGFVSSGRRDDLIFTSELSAEERRAIHLACHRFSLKSRSTGKGNARFLVVSQKRMLSELVRDVAESGGTCGQYELFAPGQG